MRQIYSEGFNAFWTKFLQVSPSPKGSKKKAFAVWKKEGLEQYVDDICKGVDVHASNDAYFKKKGQFVPSWRHGYGWLDDCSWEAVDEGELERNRAVQARQSQLDKQKDSIRGQYLSWLQEQDEVTQEAWFAKWNGKYDWMKQEI